MSRPFALLAALACLVLAPSPALARAAGDVVAANLRDAAERLRAGGDPVLLRGALPHPASGRSPARLPGRAVRPFVRPDGRLQVEVRAREGAVAAPLAARLRLDGALVQHVDALPGRLQALVPPDMLDRLAADPDVLAVEAPAYALPQMGAKTTAGDAETRAALARATLGAGGFDLRRNRRVRVGVVSDGVAGLGRSVLTGDLPAGVVVRNFTAPPGSAVQGSDCTAVAEGRALLEIVRDLAPDVELYAATVETLADYVAAVRWLADEARVDVVVDDIAFFNIGRYDGTSAAARVRTDAALSGVTYVAAVGNSALGHHRDDFTSAGPGTGSIGGVAHRFLAPSGRLPVRVGAGAFAIVYLQWDDGTPFEGEANDFDLVAFTEDGRRHDLGEGRATQAGRASDTPTELVILDNAASVDGTFEVEVVYCGSKGPDGRCTATGFAGPPPELRIFVVGNAVLADEEDLVIEESVPNGPDAAGIITVGAYCLDSNHFGCVAGGVEPYSSAGLAGIDDETIKPTLVAPDGVATTVDNVSGLGGTSLFFGTSAAAPHVGAAAAMLLSLDGSLSPDEVRHRLAESAEPVGLQPNIDYGWGRLDAEAATKPLVDRDRTITLASASLGGPITVAPDASGVPVLRLTVTNGAATPLVLAGLTATARRGTSGDERFDLARACVVDEGDAGVPGDERRLGCGLAGGRFDANDGRLLVRFEEDRVVPAGQSVTLALVYDLAVQPAGTRAVASRPAARLVLAAAPLALLLLPRARRRRAAALALAALVTVACSGDSEDGLAAACAVPAADALGASQGLAEDPARFEVETLRPGDLLAHRGDLQRVVPASGSASGRAVIAPR